MNADSRESETKSRHFTFLSFQIRVLPRSSAAKIDCPKMLNGLLSNKTQEAAIMPSPAG
jgi:hypothetical protein